jgi:hypothetical protein
MEVTTMSTTNGGYERTDANIRSIRNFIVGLFVFIGISVLLMIGLFRFLYRTGQADMPAPTPMEARRVLPPAPRLQISPTNDIEALRNNEERMLNTYGWVDRNAGVVRIPVSRAIDLLLERGLPATKPQPAQRRNLSAPAASGKQ